MNGVSLIIFLSGSAGQDVLRSPELSKTASTAESIVVRGTPIHNGLARAFIDLQDRPLRFETLGDVMAEVPGVVLFRQGGRGASQFLSIRGAAFDQTLVLIDDVAVTGPDRGAVDLSLFPVDGFSRVEIYRGSAPIRYGTGTVGGVVHLVVRGIREGCIVIEIGKIIVRPECSSGGHGPKRATPAFGLHPRLLS
ncbi:MAG: Plug domain-containing protein, partial [Myxococcota bacterium]